MPSSQKSTITEQRFRVCSYEARTEAMDSVILMGESLCRVDPSLHVLRDGHPGGPVLSADRS
jgi:hypothetical protein